MIPGLLDQPPPSQVTVSVHSIPLDYPVDTFLPPSWIVTDNLFCAGQTLMADGSLFVAGGTRHHYEFVLNLLISVGLNYAVKYDGASWTRIPQNMTGTALFPWAFRWYPTCTRLPDSRILVTGGFDLVFPAMLPNHSVEIYDPTAGGWHLVSSHTSSPPQIEHPDYCSVYSLPSVVGDSDVLLMGADGLPVFLSIPLEQWTIGSVARPGTLSGESPNEGATSVLLPLRLANGSWGYQNGAILVAGGEHGTSHEHYADVFDPVASVWLPWIDLLSHRHHPDSVLLPDGTVLLLGGHNQMGNVGVGHAILIDPANGFGVSHGSATIPEIRGYHSVALLLPDGRVLLGGGTDNGQAGGEKPDFRYYYPSYMFRNRLKLDSVPSKVSYGGLFSVACAGTSVSEAVFVALGSMTHSLDMNQRQVQLEVVSTTASSATLRAPSDPRVAPAGHYLLFVLDASRTPSFGKIIRLK